MKALFAALALLALCTWVSAQIVLPGGGSSGSTPCSAFGTTSGTCAQGNDSRITGALQTSSLGTGVQTALGNATNASGGPVVAATGCTSWTPTDQSGASLTFTSVSAQYCVYGNLVFAYGTLTYPTTASTANATISLPVAVPNQSYAVVVGTAGGSISTVAFIRTVQNTSTANIVGTAQVVAENVTLSTLTLHFFLVYPVS